MKINKKAFTSTLALILILGVVIISVVGTQVVSTKDIFSANPQDSNTIALTSNGIGSLCVKPTSPCTKANLFERTCTTNTVASCTYICMANVDGSYDWQYGRKCANGCNVNTGRCNRNKEIVGKGIIEER